MRWLAALSFGPLSLLAQPPAAAPSGFGLLDPIRLRMLKNLNEQPNYTCTETIEREFRTSAARKFQLHDVVRLEVALVDGDELFAFPGAKKFESTSLRDMIGDTGAIANGDFALHARAIFGSVGPRFEYKGTGTDGDRHFVRFDYDVPLNKSTFFLRHGEGKPVLVAYHGSFEADPSTLDIQRIEVIATEIPPALKFRQTSKKLTFARIKIGEGTFLLPAESELSIVETDGEENVNHVRFSSCRQFSGESVLSFDDPAAAAAPASAPHVEEVKLPADLDLQLSLLDDIDSRTAVVGDLVKARLLNDLRRKSQVLVRKGAIAYARLTRAEKHPDYFLIGLEFQEMEWPGGHAVLHADLTRIGAVPEFGRFLIAPPVRSHEGLIPLASRQTTLPHGLVMFWSTAP